MRRERGLLWVVLAGFVAGLVAVGAVAMGGDGDGPDPLPALAIGAGSERAAASAPGGGLASDAMGAQRVEYRVAGTLPSMPDEAAVYELGGSVGEGAVRRLAAALGLDGPTVTHEGPSWVARTDAREVRVEDVPGGPWYLSDAVTCGPDSSVSSDDGATTRVACAEPGSSGSSGSSGSGVAVDAVEAREAGARAVETAPAEQPATVEPCPMPDCPPGTACIQSCPPGPAPEPVPPPERPADLPSKDEAERIARAALDAAGVDLAGATVRVEDGWDQWFVNVEPVVDGLPTVGMTSGVGVGSRGVIRYANGWLGTPEKGETYPLATVETVIERLQGGGGGWTAYPAMEGRPEDTTVEPVVHTITDARPGLVFAPTADGRGAMLVPAFLFTVEEQPEFPVPGIAVADEYLPKPEPAPSPEPMPVEPGGGAGGSTGSAGEGCTGSGSSDGVELQLCGPSEAQAGDEVTFTLTVVDPRGAFIDSGCAEPSVSFGDGADDRAICDIGCSAPVDPQPKKFGRSFTHTYEQPGRYTASAFVRSCGEGAGDRTIELPVVVR